jgi:hypothetical protein
MYSSFIFSSADHPGGGSEIPRIIAWAPFEDASMSTVVVPIDVTRTRALKATSVGATGPGGIGANLGGGVGQSTELKYQIVDGKLVDVVPMNKDPECNRCDAIS